MSSTEQRPDAGDIGNDIQIVGDTGLVQQTSDRIDTNFAVKNLMDDLRLNNSGLEAFRNVDNVNLVQRAVNSLVSNEWLRDPSAIFKLVDGNANNYMPGETNARMELFKEAMKKLGLDVQITNFPDGRPEFTILPSRLNQVGETPGVRFSFEGGRLRMTDIVRNHRTGDIEPRAGSLSINREGNLRSSQAPLNYHSLHDLMMRRLQSEYRGRPV